MKLKILLFLGMIVGLYAVFNNISGLFSIGRSHDIILDLGRFLVALFPVIAGIVIIYVSLYNIFSGERKKDEQTDKKS